MNFRKNLQYDFPKNAGGGQRPFGTFPKIHPFWKGKASLITSATLSNSILSKNVMKSIWSWKITVIQNARFWAQNITNCTFSPTLGPFQGFDRGDKLKIKVKPWVVVEVQNIYLVHLLSKKRSILWTSSLPSSQARVTPSKSLFLFCPRPLSVSFLIRTSGKSHSQAGSAILSCKWFLPFPLEIILEMIAIGFKALGPVWRRWN